MSIESGAVVKYVNVFVVFLALFSNVSDVFSQMASDDQGVRVDKISKSELSMNIKTFNENNSICCVILY